MPIRTLTSSLLFAGLLVATLPAHADDWRVRAFGQWVSSSGDVLSGENFDDGYGVYVGVERSLNDRWGLEFGIGLSELEARQTLNLDFFGASLLTDLEASLQWVPVTVAANYHLNPGGKANFYLAPRIGWAFVDDLEVTTRVDFDGFPSFPGLPGFPGLDVDLPGFVFPDQSTSLSADDTFIYGARLGVDWPIGDGGWSLSGAIDYTVMELELEDVEVTDIDPLAVGFGFAKSW